MTAPRGIVFWIGRAVLCLWWLAGAATHALAGDAGAIAPQRVVSINLCTDQLAMLLAAEGQLISVSSLARDADSSVLAGRALDYPINHGQAEEIYLLRPDLVLAGTFTRRATVAILKRLGIRVEEFAPERSFADIRAALVRMGTLLHREQAAAALVAAFDAEVARFAAVEGRKPVAALYYANSYTSGSGTLATEVVAKAGLENLGARLGLAGTVKLPLEVLVSQMPDLVVTGRRYGARAVATDIFDHPALRHFSGSGDLAVVADRYWVCGLPFTIEAVRQLVAAARALPSERRP